MVKGEAILANLDAPFSFVVFLGMLHYSLWEMPVRGRTVTRNLKHLPLVTGQGSSIIIIFVPNFLKKYSDFNMTKSDRNHA